jgi:hypothetical protein
VNSSSIYSQKSAACIGKKYDRALKQKSQNPSFSKQKLGFSSYIAIGSVAVGCVAIKNL